MEFTLGLSNLSWKQSCFNMHHRSGDLSSLHWWNKGCISNQLLLTNLFDEFDFVQITKIRIPARAAGLFDRIHFYKSIIVAFVKTMANPSEAHDGSQSEKCFFEDENMFSNICLLCARAKGVVFCPACLLRCDECFWVIILHEVCTTGKSWFYGVFIFTGWKSRSGTNNTPMWDFWKCVLLTLKESNFS